MIFSDDYKRIVGQPCFLAQTTSVYIKKYFEKICGLIPLLYVNPSEILWYVKYCLSNNLYELVQKQKIPESLNGKIAPPKPPRLQHRSPRLTRESISKHNELQARGFGKQGYRESPRKITGGFLMNNSRSKAK